MSKRIGWIDEVRGYAIILVMLGHTYCPQNISTWLYTFHVPLFFFISGYLFSTSKYNCFKDFLISKFKSLILPMLCLGIIVKSLKFLVVPSNNGIYDFLLKLILGPIIVLRGSGFDSGLWFIPCLFISEIIFYFILQKYKNNTKRIVVILALLSILGFLYMSIISKIFFWSIDASLIAVGFIGLGYLAKTHNLCANKIFNIKYFVLFTIINLITTYITIYFNIKKETG